VKLGWTGTSLKATAAFLLSGSLLTGAAGIALAQTQTFNNVLLDGTTTPFKIENAPMTIRAGAPIVFNARNVGPAGDTSPRHTHNLAFEGNGQTMAPTTPNLTGGQSGAITFAALQPGTYTLYCPVGQYSV
jgi:plastocyanin